MSDQHAVLSKIRTLFEYNKSTNNDRVLMDGLIDLARLVDGLFAKKEEKK